MFQRGYRLRQPSGGSQHSRSPSQASQSLRPWSNTGVSPERSTGSLNRSTTPDRSSGSSSNHLSVGGYGSASCPQSSHCGDGPVIPEFEVVPPTSPTSSLDEPISTAVRQRRNSRTSHHGDPTKLTPQRTKHFKIYAKKLCEDNEVPTGEVMRFIDSGDMFYMLIDLKITLIKLYEVNKAKRLQELKDALESKDFENGLYNRLFACMLSPNITAYVTDTQLHIMDFITSHCDVFKIPPGMLEDVEVRAQLGKSVTKLLTGICSVIKTALTTSVVKHTSVADVTRALACSRSGMEVDSTHWNRIALLRCLLRIFIISISDYKSASIKELFSPYLIPSLKQDMRRKVECELGVNIEQLENDLFDNNHMPGSNNQASPGTSANDDHAPSARRNENGADMDNEEFEDQSGDGDANGEDEELNGLVEGIPARYNNTIRFWNFVDHSLLTMRQMSKESSSIPAQQDKELQKLFIEIFQADLAEFPGGKKLSKLISKTNPRWQTAIQTELIWNT
ncbi:hypothetical protein DEU56DRAFT_917613 [Suillus clintonianus]|uniref:uncharacterized protein n=1 Tax=Suillus clintonianus TaxID=1904413 RepID=UPI001B8685E8|nr:uncharacterized protein DEU56DRAFT_917613 [Suillus clintonianus]KAG2122905.1 hypothetical protein DEU56DRAFT_917613 [Suillus clintonianus]